MARRSTQHKLFKAILIKEVVVLPEELLSVLACPKCKGDLEYREKEQKLICHKCKLAYPIVDDIPVMLIDEAEEVNE